MRILTKFRTWLLIVLIALVGHSAAFAEQGWWIFRGGEPNPEPLCKALLKRLAHYDPTNSNCSYDALVTYPKFTDPPWQELDPKEHVELIAKLLKYGQEGADGYFHRLRGLPVGSDAGYRSRAKSIAEDQGEARMRLRILRLRLISSFDNGRHLAPPGEQTIVQLASVFARPPSACKLPAQPLWASGGTYLVTRDLSGPDPNVRNGTDSMLESSTIKLYEGTPVLVSWASIAKNYLPGFIDICAYEFVKKAK